MLTKDSPEVARFLKAWHEAYRAQFDSRNRGVLDYDEYYPKTARERRKYLALDEGGMYNRSGVFLADRATGEVFTIKGYGVAGRRVGTLDTLTAEYERMTTVGVTPGVPGYVGEDTRLARAGQP